MPRRRLRNLIPLALAVASIVLAMALYVFGISWWQARGQSFFDVSELYMPRVVDLVVVSWLFWVGSSVGSFLNVVAWRMPRNESVNGRSYCPRCKTQLKARDNFPVFGWIALAGRCRTCRLPIPVRYPLVEASVGLSLTVVGIAELYRLSLPGQRVHWHGGPFWTPVVDLPLLVTLLYHTVTLAFCWSFALIRVDGRRLPLRLVRLALACVAVPMLILPHLMVVPWQVVIPPEWNPSGMHLDAIIRIVTAFAMAVVLARFLALRICPGADPKLDPLGESTGQMLDLVAILTLPAIVVGWQALPAVTLLASILAILVRRGALADVDALGRLAIVMPAALTVQLTCWRASVESPWWPSAGSPPLVIFVWLAILFVVSLMLGGRQEDSRSAGAGEENDCADDDWPAHGGADDGLSNEDECEPAAAAAAAAAERVDDSRDPTDRRSEVPPNDSADLPPQEPDRPGEESTDRSAE